MMKVFIDVNSANQRFDRFLRKFFKEYPAVKLTDIFSSIRKGEILVSWKKKKAEYRLLIGDEIEIPETLLQNGKVQLKTSKEIKQKKLAKVSQENVKKMIIYEDQNWVVFNKPAGVVLHESNKHWNDLSMNDYLEFYASDCKDKTFKPSFGYRLDKDTSGVLVGAKKYEALQYLNQIIRERKIDKWYYTLVVGKTPKKFTINKSIEKVYDKEFDRSKMVLNKEGLECKTECETIKTLHHPVLGEISFLKVKIYTGRMHQIRIHLSSEGYPVLWDLIYGNPMINRKLNKLLHISRQLLHCYKYSFKDLTWKSVSFTAELPSDFESILWEGRSFIS